MKKKTSQSRKSIDERPNTYKQWCDYHPDRRAKYAFIEAATGKSVGLCQSCFDKQRRIALRRLRIEKVRSRRK